MLRLIITDLQAAGCCRYATINKKNEIDPSATDKERYARRSRVAVIRLRISIQGPTAMTVTPCATAARAIVNDTDKSLAPSSTPGSRWQCRSITGRVL